MTRPYPGAGPSRMSLLVSVLLVVALMAALLAAALALGILEFRGGGGGVAVGSPTPGQATTTPPIETPEAPTGSPTAEPATPEASPAPETPSPDATARPSPGGVHIVQPGESLFSIGLLYGVPYGEIAAANGIENPDLLQVGQELIIPQPASLTPPPGVHIVQAGESISSIAEQYGVSPTDLAEANNIENWDFIYVGQQLIIPGLGESPSPEP